MPYTREQLQERVNPDASAEVALETAEEWTDDRTGEVIEGEPFIVYGGRTWSFQTHRQVGTDPHYYESEESARLDGWVKCDNCGEWCHYEHTNDYEHIQDNVFCCSDCAIEYGYHNCEYCGDWYHEDDEVYAGDYGYCSEHCAEQDGFVRCDRCDEWVRSYDTHDVDQETWCGHCADYHASECDGCGELFPNDDMHRDEDGCWCESCYAGNGCHHGYLHQYGYTPTLHFFDESGEWDFEGKVPLFLGVELETDGGHSRQSYLNGLANLEGFAEHFWMTADSSLENGVEITGHPMTLACHVGLRELYEGISNEASTYGYKSHDGGRCGLHVHVNRSWFGKDTRVQDAGGYKLMRLMQRFEPQLTIFSRRTNTRWCNYKTYGDYKLKDEVKALRTNKDEAGVIQMAKRLKENERSHAQCVNFEHRSTYEIRIFRGTLKWPTYFACLGLVNGLCHTVKNHGSIWVESVNWYDLMAEVVERCDNDYASECLASYLDEKGLR